MLQYIIAPFFFLRNLKNMTVRGTKKSKPSSILFKLRRHMAGKESEGNHTEPWHKRGSRNS